MKEQINILLVEDSTPEVMYITTLLSESPHDNFNILAASRLQEALDRLQEVEFDLVLLDLGLPDSQGLESLSPVQAAAPEIPVVVLTGNDNRDLALQALREGAQDFLIKGEVSAPVLERVIRYAMERKRKERELQEKNVELERFNYMVSHDLKAPMLTVKTFLGYLQEDIAKGDLDSVAQDLLYIRTASDKMSRLLDELLVLSRVGRKLNPPEELGLKDIVAEAISLVQGNITQSCTAVRFKEASVRLTGDRARLVEIWQNLLDNACKFTRPGVTPEVEIGVREQGKDKLFYVRDNGRGIEAEYQGKIFNLFEKLHPEVEGTGLGLALVKRIVELYQGKIWAESGGADQGTVFYFTLPAALTRENRTPGQTMESNATAHRS